MFDSKEKKTGNDAAVTTTYNIDTEAQANAAMGKVESVPQVDAVFGAVGEDSVKCVVFWSIEWWGNTVERRCSS